MENNTFSQGPLSKYEFQLRTNTVATCTNGLVYFMQKRSEVAENISREWNMCYVSTFVKNTMYCYVAGAGCFKNWTSV